MQDEDDPNDAKHEKSLSLQGGNRGRGKSSRSIGESHGRKYEQIRGTAVDTTSGYGRPPLHSRFAKGFSGNPRGRPKGRSTKARRASEFDENATDLARLIRAEGNVVVRVETEGGGCEEVSRLELLVGRMMDAAENGDFKALKFILEHGLVPSNRIGGHALARGRQGDTKTGKAASSQQSTGTQNGSSGSREDYSVTAEKQIRSLKEKEAELMKSIAYEKSFLEKYPGSTMAVGSKRRLQASMLDLEVVQAYMRRIEFSKEQYDLAQERRTRSKSKQES